MKKAKKLLAVVLSVIMILSVVPIVSFSAFAETEGIFNYSVSGGEATITGLVDSDYSGAIEIPSTIGGYPVTSIGDWAFEDCTGLESITIPDSVTGIGEGAFYDCTGLESITIPDSVTSIGDWAFRGCTGLTSITIPGSVTEMGEGLFCSCTGLESITISDNVTDIGENTFKDCTIKNLTIANGSKSVNSTIVICKSTLESVTIPNSVTEIGESAFSGCTGLTSVTIPDSVTEIGDYAFSRCTGLTGVTIPDSVAKIGHTAFSACSGLESITVDNDNLAYHSAGNCLIETETGMLIAGCKNSVIPDDGSITGIYDLAFEDCTGLTSITIPDGVTSIGHKAFAGCTGLESITIPDSVTEIGNWAFAGCTGLTSILIPDRVTEIGEFALYACTGLTSITIGNSVTSIGDDAFEYCTGLTNITIPNSVTSIGNSAFYDCKELNDVYYTGTEQQRESIQIKSGNNILSGATWHYNNDVQIDDPNDPIDDPDDPIDDPNIIYDDDGFYEYEVVNGEVTITGLSDSEYSGDLEIPSTIGGYPVTSIGDWAFAGCTGLESITIPDSVTGIGEGAFCGCTGLESITVDNNNPVYHSAGNCLIETETGMLIAGCNNSVIPDDGSVISIGDWAFSGCSGLESITIPDGVTLIGSYAFSDCTGLTDITIPDSATEIRDWAFDDCTALEYVIISNNAINIGNGVFGDYRNYVTIYFTFSREEDNTSIDDYNYIIEWYNYNIKELLINDITLVEGTNVSLKTDDEGNKYFSYDIHPEYTVVLTDGREVTSSSTYTYIDDTQYVFKIRDDLNTKNFLPGNTYTLTGSLGGKNCSFNLTVEPTPVKKIEIVKNSNDYFVENYGGYISKDKNGNDYYHYGEYFYSPFYNKFEDAEFKITYKDGTYKTATLFEYIDGCQVTPIDNQYEHPWTVGTNNVEVDFMGVTGVLPVTVIKDPVKSMELVSRTSIKYLENVGGYLNTWNGNYYSYYTEDPTDAKIKINYTDGTSTIANVGDNINGFYVEWESNQPWSVGENASTITYLNHEVNLPITVAAEDSIKSIEAKLNFEFVEGYTIDSRYQIPYNLLNVTVNYKDGTSETKPIRKWKYITLDDNQEEKPWVVGKNYITVHYGNYTCNLEIVVKPSTSFAEKYHSTVLMDDEVKLNWLTEDEFWDLDLDLENSDSSYNEELSGPYATVLLMDDEQLSNIAKQIFDVANLQIKERFIIDNTVFVSFFWDNTFMIKTTDGENFEKVILPEDMDNFNSEYESYEWELKKHKDTYILAGLSYKIGKELFYYTSRDLITWEKHTFSIDNRTYCANLSFAGFTDNGVYFKVKKFDKPPMVVDSWLGWDIYYTTDFEDIECITESFEDYTYYQTQNYNDQLASSNSNGKIAFIAFHYYHDDVKECNPSNIDNAKLCSYNEETGKITIIESIDSQPTYWWFKLAGSDPRWYSSNYGNICYTFSVNNQNIIQTAVLPFDVDDIRAGWESNFDSNENSYHLSINVTSNEMYISGDYWRTAYIIELPEEVTDIDIDDIDFWENETETYVSINGTNGSYYFDFTPIKNALAGIHCDHIKTELKNAKKATCTENGYTGDTYCKDCGQLMEKGKVIPALGHSKVWKTIKKATFTETGLKREICTECGEVLGEEVIPVLTETYSLETAKVNEAENISVAVSEGSNLPETAEIVVQKAEVTESSITYDIHIENEGIEVQPGAPVLVKVPIPAGFDKSKLNVFRKEQDGSKTRMEIVIDGDYAYFETDHFSIYEIIEKLCGDINGDDKVNNKDLTRLFQKLSGWSVETIEAALDINGDGKVNNKDLTRLFQYLSGWAVEIY